MEKLVYALILASRKLRPYFQAQKVEVRILYPLRQILHKPETSWRVLRWVVELGQFDVDYRPRSAIKGQVLADFLLEFPLQMEGEAHAVVSAPQMFDDSEPTTPVPLWTLNVDVAVNNEKAGAGIVLISPERHHLYGAIHLDFKLTNNESEYEALTAS